MRPHQHDFSLFLRCLNCHIWGIPLPQQHYDGSLCGNCGALETVAYFPKCCLIAMIPKAKETSE